ncbi:glycosyltransferase family 4 protein [Lacisediminimonas profundi]|uniref:glycosyltransferase family 4 protein n=1 Tax=Lacisediminimonas profundi TaxID=2603856 RepID=UPI00124B36DA|nr:glycosyltransferase family 4 protein [Lacisediminimonas profundi]
MKAERILVIHNRYRERGGEDVVVDDEIRLLREHGHVVELFGRDNASIAGMGKVTLARETVWSSRTTLELERQIDEFKPDVIHVHNSFPLVSPSLYWAASKKCRPVVQTLHNFRLMCLQAMFLRNKQVCEDCKGTIPWRGVVRGCYHDSTAQSAVLAGMLVVHWSLGTFHRKVARYIALNQFSRDKFVEGGLPADRITIKPNFVRHEPMREVDRSGALFVGRLSVEKGLSLLAEAVESIPGMTVAVLGNGPELPIAQAHPQLNACGRVDRTEVLRQMNSASCLVMPSMWYETFGLVQMEAFSCGLPVIAPRFGSMAEMIDDNRTGLLFMPGSARDLAAKLAWANQHPQEMLAMGRNARSVYLEKYTPASNYRQLVAIYEAAIEEQAVQVS